MGLVILLVLYSIPWLFLGSRSKGGRFAGLAFFLFNLFLLTSIVSFWPGQAPQDNLGGALGFYLAGWLVGTWGKLPSAVSVSWLAAEGLLVLLGKDNKALHLKGILASAVPAVLAVSFPGLGGWAQGRLSEALGGLLGWGKHLVVALALAALLAPYGWILKRFKGVKLPKLKPRASEPKAQPEPSKPQPEVVEVKPPEEPPPEEIEVAEDSPGEPAEEEVAEPEEILGTQWEEPAEPEKEEKSFPVSVEASPAPPLAAREVAFNPSFGPQDFLPLFADPPQRRDEGERDAARIARLIEEKLGEFGIKGKVVGWERGPVVTRYEYEPAPGVKISKVVQLADDLALRIKALSVRVVAPLPGKGLIGIEVPNPRRKVVYFKELVAREEFLGSDDPTLFALGVDPGGSPRFETLRKMPHLLIAGTTGSGKSVCINSILSCLLMRNSPRTLRLILVDPKRVELSFYEGIPHLLLPVIKERKQAAEALKAAVQWMDIRYAHFARESVRDIEAHNSTAPERGDEPIPYIVIVIDEFADLMLTLRKEIEEPLARLAQMGRATGIHLVVATQRPSVDVITGIIKANFPVRIAFKVPSRVDSKTILDEIGAEKLLGKGDMLFIPPGSAEPQRFHGPFVSDKETAALVSRWVREYLSFRFAQAFGPRPEIPAAVERLISLGLVPAVSRSDEPAAEERLLVAAERVASALQLPSQEVLEKLKEIRESYYEPIEEMLEAPVEAGEESEIPIPEGDFDPLLPEAARLIVARGQGSATMLQRKLKIGFARAARIMDQLEELGIVEPERGTKSRRPLVGPEELEQILRKL